MYHSKWEVIILKPTSVFLTFLESQLPAIPLPDLGFLKSNSTAYTIVKQKNDEETLNEIERHFAFIFRHEIAKCLKEQAKAKIEGSFLDFLCCFKLELYSSLVVMEDSLNAGKQVIRIRPRSLLVKTIKSSLEAQSPESNILEKITLTSLAENSTTLIKNFANAVELNDFLMNYYSLLAEAEMFRIGVNEAYWPQIKSYQNFCKYFTVDFHSQLIHLS